MRCLSFALVTAIVPLTGCSGFVAARGTDLTKFETKEQVRKEFGTPTTTGDGAEPYDEFRTHRKISDRSRGEGISMAFAMTLGLSEFISLPTELHSAARQRIEGQTIRFVYDEQGKVSYRLVNGGTPVGLPPPPRPDPPPTPTATTAEQHGP